MQNIGAEVYYVKNGKAVKIITTRLAAWRPVTVEFVSRRASSGFLVLETTH